MGLWDFRDIFHELRSNVGDPVTIPVPGTLAAGDLFGDTTNDTGALMPKCRVTGATYTFTTAPDASTDITVHNVTQGTSHTETLSAAAGSFTMDLAFADDDELAVEAANVGATAAGDDLVLVLDVESRLVHMPNE